MRHARLPRIFDLSKFGYFMDFALVPIASGALAWFSMWRGLDAPWFAAGIGLGMVAWSLAEYWIHRAIFHGKVGLDEMHEMHHALPKDMIGVASWGTFTGFAGVWLVAQTFAGSALGSAITAGFLAGYLFYCTIHVAMHHGGARGFGLYGALMLRLHQAHHRGGKGNFGVSSPIWDFVFGTYRPTR